MELVTTISDRSGRWSAGGFELIYLVIHCALLTATVQNYTVTVGGGGSRGVVPGPGSLELIIMEVLHDFPVPLHPTGGGAVVLVTTNDGSTVIKMVLWWIKVGGAGYLVQVVVDRVVVISGSGTIPHIKSPSQV